MAEQLVTGIAQTSDPGELQRLLIEGATLDPARLAVINKMSPNHDGAGGGGHAFNAGASIMTGSSGTGVPGMGSSHASLSSFVGHGATADYLGGLTLIPSDQAANYNIAISEGRSLVTYKAHPGEAEAVERAFREAGLRKVRTYSERVPA